MTISKEERIEWRKEAEPVAGIRYKEDIIILRLLDALEAAERKTTMPCPHCDLSSGQRGGDRCPHCDGTGRVSVVSELKSDRDEWKARAEAAERERDAVITPLILVRCCPDRDISACIKDGFTAHKEIGRCRLCWLAWARQQARGEGE